MADTIPTSGTYTLNYVQISNRTGNIPVTNALPNAKVTFNGKHVTITVAGQTTSLIYDYSWGANNQKIIILGTGDGKQNSYIALSDPSVNLDDYSFNNKSYVNFSNYKNNHWILTNNRTHTSSNFTTDRHLNAEGNWIVCFLDGSMIRTPSGDVAIEDISAGNEILTRTGAEITVQRVTWVGKAHCVVRPELSDDQAGYPVRILKDAIAEGVPFKDMLITAEHCLFFDEKFIPARMLVNGRSIFFDKSITSYDYYHLETERHSVIIADGMLTESYLDTGNRRAFGQKGNIFTLPSAHNLTWDDAAAPLDVSREFVEPLFRHAEARALAAGVPQREPTPELTDEADLCLTTDTGAIIRPAREHKGRAIFMIPKGVQAVRIVSNASRLSDVIGPFVDDRRYFGVSVGEITLLENSKKRTIRPHLTETELDGWNALEGEEARWTSGNALLPLGPRHSHDTALMTIQIKETVPYLLMDTLPAKTAIRA